MVSEKLQLELNAILKQDYGLNLERKEVLKICEALTGFFKQLIIINKKNKNGNIQ